MSRVSEIRIPVRDVDGRSGKVEIIKGINTRTVYVQVGDDCIVLEQEGIEEVPPYQVGIMTGTLHRLMEERKVSGGKWKVRDFILAFEGDKRGVQHRLLQAVDEVVEKLSSIPLGTKMVVEVRFMGREWHNVKRNGLDYWNLDEATAIHIF